MKNLIIIFGLLAVAYCNIMPRLDGKIVGGHDAEIENYPYQVSFRLFDSHFCGGSILDANTVLTAGHCVHESDLPQFSVRVGSSLRNDGASYTVSKVIAHPKYDANKIDYDVAILKLATPLNFSSTVQPVPLQPKGVDVPFGTKAWVSGWGFMSEGGMKFPENLQVVDVAVITNRRCSIMYGRNKITKHMMCAQTLYHDSCQGDSGGPLVANGKLIGVVSWGYGCARPRFPGVYAKVSDMYDWIMKNK